MDRSIDLKRERQKRREREREGGGGEKKIICRFRCIIVTSRKRVCVLLGVT